MKKYLVAALVLASCALSQAQQFPSSRDGRNGQPQVSKRCPAGFVLDNNGNCQRLEAEQLQNE